MRTLNKSRISGCELAGIILMVLWWSSAAVTGRADVLTLNTGDELFGTVKRMTASEVVFLTDGTEKSYPATSALKVEFEAYRMIPGEETVASIKDPVITDTLAHLPTKEEFPQAARLDVLDEERYDLRGDGTWDYSARQVFIPFKEQARDDANHAFSYFPDIETADIEYGRSITPPKKGVMGLLGGDSGTVRYVSDHTIADETDFMMLPQYQRRHTVKFAIPEVNPGTIVDRQYRVTRKKADPLLPLFIEKVFRGSEPARTIRLVVSVPRNLTLHVQTFGDQKGIDQKNVEKGDRVEWTFTAHDTTGILSEPFMPSLYRQAPRVAASLEPSWSKISTDWKARLGELRQQALHDPAFEKAFVEMTRNASGTEAIVQAVFRSLADQITTVGVVPQAFHFLPQSPVSVLASRQGNGLDKAFLFDCLLERAKIRHSLLLLRSREEGGWASETPSLGQATLFAIEIPENPAWKALLPFSRHYGISICPAFLQGATGIRLDDGTSVTVPFASAREEERRIELTGVIREDGTLIATKTVSALGNHDPGFRSLLDLRREEIGKDFEQALFQEFPGAHLRFFAVNHLQDWNKTPEVVVEFEVASYAIRSGNDLMVIPVPVNRGEYSASAIGSPRRYSDMTWSSRLRCPQTISLKIPAGFGVYALPEGMAARGPGMWYQAGFGFAVDTVTFRDLLEREAVDLSADTYSSFREFMEERSQTANLWLVIRRLSNEGSRPSDKE